MLFLEVHETYNPIEASLVKAKLNDDNIPFTVSGDFDISYSMEAFNTTLSRMALKRPIKFFVPEQYFEIAKVSINTDNSSMLNDEFEY
ncbi:MAG: hypothetical protein OZ913_07480 [Ignavibacteriaceae bacterium]|jgi:hypothetical protein|nr:MAG: hypothetical protein EDM69_06030 [Chlorobiota bacterium]KXK06437.1 MAG: hypothetical protein UZ04_CHB001000440 [Chlorobi bacterium OLB4]MBV6399051.1 hypothetical protein [Ignavibacteria bacterium]MCC6885269.1 hypothetical protein [Ignavibacteriales bacterium]MCE7953329.1 hypothetical protein [Chlorobi bacterium CHB7]MDL1887254.1 hypothetical protein [Ignavibacteria bacterium CHB1]MEB2330129.1 hypothetical protein [Ignavibacteriaceae bacterium]OQY78191.1 MAG: hypothetical protein B6D4